MSQWPKRLEVTTNIATLLMCLVIGGLIGRNYLLPKRPLPTQNRIPIGSTLSVPGVQWQRTGKTIVLAISTQCHFCADSMPFYQKLVQAASIKNARIIGLFPQTTDESKNYLTNHQVAVAEVHQVSLARIGVQGTPTLMIVDASGKVTAEWVGKLDPAREAEVLAAL